MSGTGRLRQSGQRYHHSHAPSPQRTRKSPRPLRFSLSPGQGGASELVDAFGLSASMASSPKGRHGPYAKMDVERRLKNFPDELTEAADSYEHHHQAHVPTGR